MSGHKGLNRLLVVALCVGTAFAASSPVFLGFDARVMAWVHAHRISGFIDVALVITRLGSTPVGLAVVVLGSLLFLIKRRGSDALLLTTAVGLELRLIGPLKRLFDRPRPIFLDQTMTFVGSGFPSGHAMTITAICTALSLSFMRHESRPARRRAAKGIAAGVIATVAATRIYLGAHFLTDVVGGVAFGLLATIVCDAGVDWLEPYLNAPS